MQRKVELFSPNVLPHYDGQYKISDKVGDLSITKPVKYAIYTKEAGWAPVAPKRGWIGMSHRLSSAEGERLRSEILFWEPGAPNTVDHARKAVKLFRNFAQARALRGNLALTQLASFYFQVAKSLVGVVQMSQWEDDFPTPVDIQAQKEGAIKLNDDCREAVSEAVSKFMEGDGRDLPPTLFRVVAGEK